MKNSKTPSPEVLPARSQEPVTVVVVQVSTLSVDPETARAELRSSHRVVAAASQALTTEAGAALGAQLAERLLAPLAAPGLLALPGGPSTEEGVFSLLPAGPPAHAPRSLLVESDYEDAELVSESDSEESEADEESPAFFSGPAPQAACDPALSRSLQRALEAGKRRPRTPPGQLLAQYERIAVEAWDGASLEVCPRVFRCLDTGLDAHDRVRSLEQLNATEAPLRELLALLREERDERANPLFLRVLGCRVGELARADLGPVVRVFRGQGAPREVAGVLALVDRYANAPGTSPAARQEMLAAYFSERLGFSPDGFALNYQRMLFGGLPEPIAPRLLRETTDDLMVGDVVLWADGRVGVLERVWNLLSRYTRVEVIESRHDVPSGLTKSVYRLLPAEKKGAYTLSESGAEVLISAP